MNNPKISVIIPAYNTGRAVRRMINAVKKQTFEEFEAIIIDDGSEDDTVDIIKENIMDDDRFRLITIPHGGVHAARNAGLDEAAGEYICFFDSDDYVPANSLFHLYRSASNREADLAIGQICIVDFGESRLTKSSVRLSKKKNIGKFNKDINFTLSLCNKIFRNSVIKENGIRFRDLRRGEDALFLFEYIGKCGKITGCPHAVYHYRKMPFWKGVSLSQQIVADSLLDSHRGYMMMVNQVKENIANDESSGTDYENKEEINEQRSRYLSSLYRRFTVTVIKKYYRNIWLTDDEVIPLLKEHLEEYKSNMNEKDWEVILRQNSDLKLEDGLKTKKELAGDPVISIVISDSFNEKNKGMIDGIYQQSFPAFEILMDKNCTELFPKEHLSQPNMHIIPHKRDMGKFKRKALEQCKGKFVLFLDEYCMPSYTIFRELYNESPGRDCMTAPLHYFKGEKVWPLDVYELIYGNKTCPDITSKEMKDLDKRIWSNKLFRTDTLKKADKIFKSYGENGLSTMNRIFEMAQPFYYSDGRFLTKLTDKMIIKYLGDEEREKQIMESLENGLSDAEEKTLKNEDEESREDDIIEQSEEDEEM